MKAIKDAFVMLIALTVLTGIVYPLVITAVANICFLRQAGGSLITRDGRILGSSLIGRQFTGNRYFHSRPSVIGYNPLPSGGSNLSPASLILADSAAARRTAFRHDNHLKESDRVPDDMVFASGSGLDPDISRLSAFMQVNRIATVRGLGPGKVKSLRKVVASFAYSGQWAIFPDDRVNVLLLNLALDSLDGKQQ